MARVRSGTRLKMLAFVVDDSEIVGELIADALREAGFEVIVLQNAIGLRARLLRDRPDILVLDATIPPFEASDIVVLIRTHATLWRLPILLVSGRPEAELRVIAHKCGVDDYATKEDATKVALRAVNLMLGRRSSKLEPG